MYTIPSHLRKSYPPSVDYIEKIPTVLLDLTQLLAESRSVVAHVRWEEFFMQSRLALMTRSQWLDSAADLNYTKQSIETLKQYLPFNSVYYRILKPFTCYNWHQDAMQTCLHIPLNTHQGCRFVYEHCAFHLPADGSVYIVNNSKPHSFINASPDPRLHITMDIF